MDEPVKRLKLERVAGYKPETSNRHTARFRSVIDLAGATTCTFERTRRLLGATSPIDNSHLEAFPLDRHEQPQFVGQDASSAWRISY